MSLVDSVSLSVTTPLVTIIAAKLVVSGGSAPVRVVCIQAACQGSIELTIHRAARRHARRFAVTHGEPLVLATGLFSLAEGNSRIVVLSLTVAGRRMLAHANRRRPIAAKLTLSGKDGKAITKSVLVV
jgi:hypothetical protein